VNDFRKIAEQSLGQQLTWFFTQWLDSTGAPEFKNKYTVYRTQKGFRVVGEIQPVSYTHLARHTTAG